MRAWVIMAHYEELQSVFARLDRVLPGQARRADDKDEGWDWRNTVIEAQPIRLLRLTPIGDTAVFRKDIPAKHQKPAHRRWYVAEQTQVLTTNWQAVQPGALPPGVSLWHASDTARRLIVLAMHDACELFRGQTWQCTLPANDEWRICGRLTLFDTPGPAELCFKDSVRLLAYHGPYLARLMREYARSIAWMYGMPQSQFEEACRVHVAWHAPGSSSPARLSPASSCRYENGPIVWVAIGKPVSTHDFIPALPDISSQEHAARLEVSEGVMVCTDGPARVRYSHGYPCQQGEKSWFTLTYYLDCTRQSLAVGYDRETRSLIMATPIRKDRVVPGTALDSPPSGGLALDLMGALVKDMRLRLRVAESHLLSASYEKAFTSSSSKSLE